MPAAPNSPLPPDHVDPRPALVARTLYRIRQSVTLLRHNRILALVVLCGLGMILCSAGSVAFYFLGPGAVRDAERNLQRAFAALDAGRYEDARRLVARRWRTAALPPAQQGYPLIIMGLALAHEAEQPGRGADRTSLYLLGARYLQEAEQGGIPAQRRGQVALELARCLYLSGRYAESLPALQAAIDMNPDAAPRLWRWLATAYRRDAVPQLRPALAALEQALEGTDLAPDERDEATVEQAMILFQLGDLDGCRAALARLAPASSVAGPARVLEARCLVADGDRLGGAAGADLYRRAIGILESELAAGRTGAVERSARYLLGVTYRQLGDLNAAGEAYRRTRRMYPGSDEGLAATLDEADLQHSQGYAREALDLYLAVAREAPAPGVYANSWLPLSELQARLQAALHRFQTARQFAAAVTLCGRLGELLPADELTEVEAQTLEAWGDWLAQPERDGAARVALAHQVEARAHFRAAAEAYQRLAALRFATPHYPQDTWKSGHCFRRGHNFTAAIPLLQRYLDCAPRRQHAPGLLELGECHLALGNFHQALDVLRHCIDLFPKHPETYRARLLASQACVQLQQYPEAKQFLIDNLHNSDLTPQSIPWQRSLFAYGQLLFTTTRTDAAAWHAGAVGATAADTPSEDQRADLAQRWADVRRYLQEAVARYPDAESAQRARYWIAESWRYAAQLPEHDLKTESAPSRRQQLQEERRSDLVAAAEAYRQLQAASSSDNFLSSGESAVARRIRRNAALAWAGTLYDLEDFPAAVQAYANASQQYADEPVAVEALARLAQCYRRQRAHEQAQEAVMLARTALDRVPDDTDLTLTTRHSREGWRNLLDWLAQL